MLMTVNFHCQLPGDEKLGLWWGTPLDTSMRLVPKKARGSGRASPEWGLDHLMDCGLGLNKKRKMRRWAERRPLPLSCFPFWLAERESWKEQAVSCYHREGSIPLPQWTAIAEPWTESICSWLSCCVSFLAMRKVRNVCPRRCCRNRRRVQPYPQTSHSPGRLCAGRAGRLQKAQTGEELFVNVPERATTGSSRTEACLVLRRGERRCWERGQLSQGLRDHAGLTHLVGAHWGPLSTPHFPSIPTEG